MRVLERFLSLLLALAVIVGAVLLALEVGWAIAGKPPLLVQWNTAYTAGTTNSWDTAASRVTAIVILAVGLLLLVVTLKPRRAPRLALISTETGVDAAITRRSLRSTLLTAAQQVDGISAAKAKVSKRRATVQARSRLGTDATAQALTGQLEAALRARLDDLQLARPPKLRARVSARPHTRSS